MNAFRQRHLVQISQEKMRASLLISVSIGWAILGREVWLGLPRSYGHGGKWKWLSVCQASRMLWTGKSHHVVSPFKTCAWFHFAARIKSTLFHRPCQTFCFSLSFLLLSLHYLAAYDFFQFLNTIMLSSASKSEPMQFLLPQTHILAVHDSLPLWLYLSCAYLSGISLHVTHLRTFLDNLTLPKFAHHQGEFKGPSCVFPQLSVFCSTLVLITLSGSFLVFPPQLECSYQCFSLFFLPLYRQCLG